MNKQFKLTPHFEGKNFQIYLWKSTEALPKVPTYNNKCKHYSKRDLIKLGYREWEPGDKESLPTHFCTVNQKFYRLLGQEPLTSEITFLKELNEELEIIDKQAFKVPSIPKMLCLTRGKWVAPKELMYPKCSSKSQPLQLTKTVLEVLDQRNIVPTGINCGPCSSVLGTIPVEFDTEYHLISTENIQELNVPIELMSNNLPLKLEETVAKWEFYIKDGAYWQECTKTFSAEESLKTFGLYQAITITPKWLIYQTSHKIKLTDIEYVECDGYLNLDYKRPIKNISEIVLNTTYEELKSSHQPIKNLRLKNPGIEISDRHRMINPDTDWESLDIVQVNRKILQGDSWFYLVYLKDGVLIELPGKYLYKKDVVFAKPRRTKEELKTYENLTLTHKLPDKLTNWSISDLLEYDQLMSTGKYRLKPGIKIGDYVWEIQNSDEIIRKYPLLFQTREFQSLSKRQKHKIWKINTITECANILKNSTIKPEGNEILEASFILLELGINPIVIIEELARAVGLSEIQILNILNQEQGE